MEEVGGKIDPLNPGGLGEVGVPHHLVPSFGDLELGLHGTDRTQLYLGDRVVLRALGDGELGGGVQSLSVGRVANAAPTRKSATPTQPRRSPVRFERDPFEAAGVVGASKAGSTGVSRNSPKLRRFQLGGRKLSASSRSKTTVATVSGGACSKRIKNAPKTPRSSAHVSPQKIRCAVSRFRPRRRRNRSAHSRATPPASMKIPTFRPDPPTGVPAGAADERAPAVRTRHRPGWCRCRRCA